MLAPMNRDLLQQALAGDIPLMAKLIADWDVDAQLLELTNQIPVKRLPSHVYLRSQILARQLLNKTEKGWQQIERFLPQTYVAASFLLALADTEQIVALPQGLRKHTHLFPKALTDQIPQDIDRYNAETLFMAQPNAAFVAHYSHPALLDTLRDQGVPLYTLQHLDSIGVIKQTLMQVGEIVHRPLEAELLALFMDAAFLTIDNRIAVLQHSMQEKARLLFVTHHDQYFAPTAKTLTGQLLKRMGIVQIPVAEKSEEWSVPIFHEDILHFNPHRFVIATPQCLVKPQFYQDALFKDLIAMQSDKVFFVDEIVQQFPSQYIVLAYYDLFKAL